MDFTSQNSLYLRGTRVMSGIIYSNILSYPTFIHMDSTFKDQWYNFIVPTIEVGKFDWDGALTIRKEQKEKFDKNVSFYVYEKFVSLLFVKFG